jgi:outer membrane murein-binding lipoprotein Lpp
MDTGVAVALITGIAGVVIAIVGGYFSLRVNEKVTALEKQADKLQDRVKELECENQAQRKRVRELGEENAVQNKRLDRIRKILREWWEGIQSLLHQIGEAGLTPVWKPDKPQEIEEELA